MYSDVVMLERSVNFLPTGVNGDEPKVKLFYVGLCDCAVSVCYCVLLLNGVRCTDQLLGVCVRRRSV